MKISTDSVLLGAWAKPGKAKQILDIGTGSGVITLMLAQKAHPAVSIDAIDIDPAAYLQAQQNFSQSKWSKNLNAHNRPIQNFKSKKKYDLIVSNPPFFVLPHTHKDKEGTQARYTHMLPFDELAESVVRLLAPHGRFCVIFPIHEGASFANEAEKRNLFLSNFVWVKTTTRKKFPKRILMEFEFSRKADIKEELLIIQKDNKFTEEYKELTKDYYLRF